MKYSKDQIEMVWTCDVDGRRGYLRKCYTHKEWRENNNRKTENQMEGENLE